MQVWKCWEHHPITPHTHIAWCSMVLYNLHSVALLIDAKCTVPVVAPQKHSVSWQYVVCPWIVLVESLLVCAALHLDQQLQQMMKFRCHVRAPMRHETSYSEGLLWLLCLQPEAYHNPFYNCCKIRNLQYG